MLAKMIEYVKRYRFRVSMIIVNAVISTLPIILIGTIVQNIILSGNVEKLNSSVDTSFNQINSQLDTYFNSIRQFSKVVFFDDRVMDVLENDPKLENDENIFMFRDYFSSVMQMNLNIKDIYIVTSKNRQAGTNNIALGEEILTVLEENRSDKSEFSFLVPDTLIGGGNTSIIARQNIRFKDSLHYAGIGAILLNKNDFMKSLESVNRIKGMDVFVSDSNGKLIAASDGMDFAVMQYIVDNHIQGEGVFEINGEEFLLRQGTLSSTGWRITAVVRASEIYKEVNWIKQVILITTLLILALTIAATLFYNFSISKYFKELTNAFQNVSFNNMDVRLDFGKGHEMEYISTGFNNMISELKMLTRRALDTQQRLYEIELQKINAELYGLQSQINSHFLYNTLGSIRGMARLGNAKEADTTITGLVSILRYATDKTELVSLDDEINNVKNYVEIQNSVTRKIILKTDVDEEAETLLVHKLILQPVIENSILHGFENKRTGTILIKARCYDDSLTVKIFDNGCGISEDTLSVMNSVLETALDMPDVEKKHIGLANIQKRLRICYGNEYGIKVKSWQGKGTVLILKLPKLKERGNSNV